MPLLLTRYTIPTDILMIIVRHLLRVDPLLHPIMDTLRMGPRLKLEVTKNIGTNNSSNNSYAPAMALLRCTHQKEVGLRLSITEKEGKGLHHLLPMDLHEGMWITECP